MKSTFPLLASILLLACPSSDEDGEAGVGGDRSGCGGAGTHSTPLADHSCECEPGYSWCSDAIDDFECCPSDDTGDGGTGAPPDSPCEVEQAEQIACLDDPEQPGPGTQTWACNGEDWVSVPGLAEFECMTLSYQFGYGCLPGVGTPQYVCGYGPGSPCDETQASLCVDDSIIDTCIWGRRAIDYCRRLCADLQVWGPGFTNGQCSEDLNGISSCQCW